MSKYKSVRTTIDGITFASKAESRRYIDLCLLKQAHCIKSFELQPKFDLPGGIKYIADFKVTDNQGKTWVEDVKGYQTDVFKIKAKLFKVTYPEIELRVIE